MGEVRGEGATTCQLFVSPLLYIISMRTMQTFILRLLVDSGEPHALRGLIRSVASGEEHAFTVEEDLLQYLRNLPNRVPGDASANGIEQQANGGLVDEN